MKAYGYDWPYDDPIDVEIDCIRRRGKWQAQGRWYGEGFFHHYKALQSAIWPWKKWDPWSELILQNLIVNRFTILAGPANASKTHSVAAYILARYICFPVNNCSLVSSTDSRSLELRIWGEIKKLWNEALARYEDTPGRIIESKQMIVTDNKYDKATDFRNGLVAIPCLVGGQFVGLGKYVGIKSGAVFLAADECFPAGTPVDTPEGQKPIEQIQEGDLVLSAAGWNPVSKVFFKYASQMVKITLSDGRQIKCTPTHPVFTQNGWEKACNLHQGSYMMSAYETMRLLRQTNRIKRAHTLLSILSFSPPAMQILPGNVSLRQPCEQARILQLLLRDELVSSATRLVHETCSKPFCRQAQIRSRASRILRENCQEPDREVVELGKAQAAFNNNERARHSSSDPWWEWDRANQGRAEIARMVSERNLELPNQDRAACWEWIPNVLQSRSWNARSEAGCRGTGLFAQQSVETGEGRQEEGLPRGAWVDRVEFYEQADSLSEDIRLGEEKYRVYNLSVEGHPSYSVNGLVVHNCQFMSPAFSDGISNMSKNSGFKGVAIGNPKDRTDVFGRLAEPDGGWETYAPTGKTMVWKTRFVGGKCIQLDGRDSPNNTAKEGEGWPFPHLINREDIQRDIAYYGEDSIQVSMMDYGIFPKDAQARRVITRSMCERHRAQEEPIWSHEPLLYLFVIDAAYGAVGGDRCVGIEMAFGKCADGVVRLAFVGQPNVIPVKNDLEDDQGKPILPESQIVRWVRAYCENPMRLSPIPLGHIGFDSTGRGSLVKAFADEWGNEFHAVEFGGPPSDRPVSAKIQTPCNIYYFNMVSELWFNVSTLILADQCRALPTAVMEEFCMRAWDLVKDKKVQVEPKSSTTGKPGCKQRMGRSPDLADCATVGVEVAQRIGFQLGQGGEGASKNTPRWLQELLERQKEVKMSHRLQYR